MSLTKEQRLSLAQEIGLDVIERVEGEVAPDWDKPLIIPRANGDMVVSLTNNLTGGDEYDQVLAWAEFCDMIMTSDPDIIEGLIPKYEALLEQMKKSL